MIGRGKLKENVKLSFEANERWICENEEKMF